MIRQRINLPLSLPSDATHLIIPEQYKISFRNKNFLLYDGKMMERKTEIMCRRVWEKVRENVEINANLPCVILRRHLLIHLCFAIRAHH
ncbi:LOW QUALITY PROTEIN: hypothetical protein HZS_6667 [Henneguya salminicola]|nr:LOW QUALITY PROTEIN: hypothetical protein HZS_6667 [Henneguya salminicola]